jgi:leucyl aminopeptidase
MGELMIEVRPPGEGEPDSLAIPFPQDGGGNVFSNGMRDLDGQLEGRLQQLADSGELKGDLGTAVVLHTNGDLSARRVVVAGIGKKDDLDADALRTAASAVAHRIADGRKRAGGEREASRERRHVGQRRQGSRELATERADSRGAGYAFG